VASERSKTVGEIVLNGVTKVFPNGVSAVDDISLTIDDGEFMVLVGPSGCGKTTLLRMIAGLEEVTEGMISIAGKDVTDVAPRNRDIAMIFQNYALYPHMNVRKNLGYSLRVHRMRKKEIERRVNEVAKMIGLADLLDRRPVALSGGQRQRVAMGRAIIREPAAFLMDEPLSNLDAKLRVGMRASLAQLHERLKVTTVYVTHDQVEAMTLGHRVAVMRDGVILQVDTPQMLYSEPINLFVAAFIGSPAMNLVEAEIEGDTVKFAGNTLQLNPARRPAIGKSGQVILGIRPESFEDTAVADPSLPTIEVQATVFEELGSDKHVIFTIDAPRVDAEELRAAADHEEDVLITDDRAVWNARVDSKMKIKAGEKVRLAVDSSQFYFFDPDTNLSLTAGGQVASVA
jgi:multiple sugar transport system ATP-binding protein